MTDYGTVFLWGYSIKIINSIELVFSEGMKYTMVRLGGDMYENKTLSELHRHDPVLIKAARQHINKNRDIFEWRSNHPYNLDECIRFHKLQSNSEYIIKIRNLTWHEVVIEKPKWIDASLPCSYGNSSSSSMIKSAYKD